MKIEASGFDRKPWHTDEYVEYLASEEWAEVRKAALERAGHRCEYAVTWCELPSWTEHVSRCPETTGLQVHHKRYDSLGAEAWGDLVVLCADHHRAADRSRQAGKKWARRTRW